MSMESNEKNKSIENIQKFYNALRTDERLYKKLDAIDEQFDGAKLDKSKKREIIEKYIIPIAKEWGLPFTLEDLDEFEKAQKEISLDDMNGVAGGVTSDILMIGNVSYDRNNLLKPTRGGENDSKADFWMGLFS